MRGGRSALTLLLVASACGRGEADQATLEGALPMVVSDVRVPHSADGESMSVYAKLRNQGHTANTLLSVTSSIAAQSSLHEMSHEGGLVMMRPLTGLAVPAGAEVELSPGHLHGMLEGLRTVPDVGDSIEVRFEFACGGDVFVDVAVIDWADILR